VALWKPDPSFYPSPKMAMEAPPEKLAYVAVVNPKQNARPTPWPSWTSKARPRVTET